MADYEDTKVTDLVINNMSQEKFEELKTAGELDPTQIYLTPTEESGGASLPDQTGNAGKFLQTDGTTVSWGEALVNAATGKDYGLAVGPLSKVYNTAAASVGYATSAYKSGGIVFGAKSRTYSSYSVVIGYESGTYSESAPYCIMMGYYSTVDSNVVGAMQFGKGKNTESGTVCFGLTTDGTTWNNYKLLDTDGTMPTDRYTTTPTVAGTYLPKLGISGDGTATREWVDFDLDRVIVNNSGSGFALGYEASADDGVAIGYGANASFQGVAIGEGATAGALGIALGYDAVASDTEFVVNIDGNNIKITDHTGLFPRERMSALVEVLPTAENGYATVKNYGNGYVEITGYTAIGTVGASTGSEVQIDLPTGYTMANANYWVNIAPTSETTMFDFKAEAKARSTTHFMVAYKNEDTTTGLTAAGVYWEVRGMLATE